MSTSPRDISRRASWNLKYLMHLCMGPTLEKCYQSWVGWPAPDRPRPEPAGPDQTRIGVAPACGHRPLLTGLWPLPPSRLADPGDCDDGGDPCKLWWWWSDCGCLFGRLFQITFSWVWYSTPLANSIQYLNVSVQPKFLPIMCRCSECCYYNSDLFSQ